MKELKLMCLASVLLGCIAESACLACKAASEMSASLAARKERLERSYADAQDAEAHWTKHGMWAFSADCTLLELAERFGVKRCWLNPNAGNADMELRCKLPACMSSASADRIEVRSCRLADASDGCDGWNVRIRTRVGSGFASLFGGFREGVSFQEVLDEDRQCFRELQAVLREKAHFEWRLED